MLFLNFQLLIQFFLIYLLLENHKVVGIFLSVMEMTFLWAISLFQKKKISYGLSNHYFFVIRGVWFNDLTHHLDSSRGISMRCPEFKSYKEQFNIVCQSSTLFRNFVPSIIVSSFLFPFFWF